MIRNRSAFSAVAGFVVPLVVSTAAIVLVTAWAASTFWLIRATWRFTLGLLP